ncbi:hypothetical protein [Lysobacter sp. 1R34A]|uniref:hypothetical protein n=1 Tax=Lysobacter sp. 1R34A TaxID=3445786 RepID=UPI003EEDF060
MKNACIAALLLLSASPAVAQTAPDAKVASFETGSHGSRDREAISFWKEHGKRANIEYQYGSDDKTVKLAYLGVADCGGEACFKVGFPNKHVLYVTPGTDTVRLSDVADPMRAGKANKYDRTFSWRYEGPVDGRGTFCSVCAQDGKDASAMLRQFFLKK